MHQIHRGKEIDMSLILYKLWLGTQTRSYNLKATIKWPKLHMMKKTWRTYRTLVQQTKETHMTYNYHSEQWQVNIEHKNYLIQQHLANILKLVLQLCIRCVLLEQFSAPSQWLIFEEPHSICRKIFINDTIVTCEYKSGAATTWVGWFAVSHWAANKNGLTYFVLMVIFNGDVVCSSWVSHSFVAVHNL